MILFALHRLHFKTNGNALRDSILRDNQHHGQRFISSDVHHKNIYNTKLKSRSNLNVTQKGISKLWHICMTVLYSHQNCF